MSHCLLSIPFGGDNEGVGAALLWLRLSWFIWIFSFFIEMFSGATALRSQRFRGSSPHHPAAQQRDSNYTPLHREQSPGSSVQNKPLTCSKMAQRVLLWAVFFSFNERTKRYFGIMNLKKLDQNIETAAALAGIVAQESHGSFNSRILPPSSIKGFI